MSPGQLVRKLLGKKLFAIVGRFYRAVFVNLEVVANYIAAEVPRDAHLLDIGGGDGAPLNFLLAKRPDIRVTMIDLSETIGNSISAEYRSRVTLLPGMSVAEYIATQSVRPDCVVIADVVHHVVPKIRERFFVDLHQLVKKSSALLLIKDIEPGSFVSLLSYLSDRYISGDKHVQLISKGELCSTIERVFGDVTIRDVGLFEVNPPNYMVSVRVAG